MTLGCVQSGAGNHCLQIPVDGKAGFRGIGKTTRQLNKGKKNLGKR